MKKNLVSILLPIYQDRIFLTDCLNSILKQSHENFELLILDRCPAQNDRALVQSFNDPRIKYRCESLSNQEAIIKLFSEANGKFIKLFCPDDIMLENCLESLLLVFQEKNHVAAVFSNMFTISDSGKFHKKDILFSKPFSNRFLFTNYVALNRNPLLYPTVMINKDKVGIDIFDKRFKQCFDLCIWLSIALKYKGEFGYVNTPLVGYRLRKNNGNMSTAFSKETAKKVTFEYKKIISFIMHQIEVSDLVAIFPESIDFLPEKSIGLEKKFIPAVIALYFLKQKKWQYYGVAVYKQVAIDTLFDLLEDKATEEFLRTHFSFSSELLKEHISTYYEKNIVKRMHKFSAMFMHYMQEKGLFFTFRKTFYYLFRF